ncbi:MAG: hypothetical protein H8E82_06855 [Candidatus Marinimicrobia bacterium]|nr:hypothetical protein [Candidatus Neomarinimicrobiota bacterium]
MNKKKKKKEFNTVKMMRNIRDKLSEIYRNNPEIEEKELRKIRQKYDIKPKLKISA